MHAFDDRSPSRGIDINDALRILQIGEIEGRILPGTGPGEWKCKVVAKAEQSSRRIGVATVLLKHGHLLIATVEWEDK